MKLLKASPALLHSEIQAVMKPTKPCSKAIDKTDSRLSICNTQAMPVEQQISSHDKILHQNIETVCMFCYT